MTYKLDDIRLIKQCGRLKKLIKKVGLTEAGQNIYGASYHNYKILEPITLEEVQDYEQSLGVKLPIELVYYITLVGRGGAGPYNGFYDRFFILKDESKEYISTASDQLQDIITDEEWEVRFGEEAMENLPDEDYIRRDAGTICLTGMDTTYLAHLIVTGKHAGKVVYLDWEEESPPIWPKGYPNFLDWCENWFKKVLSGDKVYGKGFI